MNKKAYYVGRKDSDVLKWYHFAHFLQEKVSTRVLESECFSLMHDDPVKMLTKSGRWLYCAWVSRLWACQNHDPLLCLPSFLSGKLSEVFVQENVPQIGKIKIIDKEKNLFELS